MKLINYQFKKSNLLPNRKLHDCRVQYHNSKDQSDYHLLHAL